MDSPLSSPSSFPPSLPVLDPNLGLPEQARATTEQYSPSPSQVKTNPASPARLCPKMAQKIVTAQPEGLRLWLIPTSRHSISTYDVTCSPDFPVANWLCVVLAKATKTLNPAYHPSGTNSVDEISTKISP